MKRWVAGWRDEDERQQLVIMLGETFERLIVDMGGERKTGAIVKYEWYRALLP